MTLAVTVVVPGDVDSPTGGNVYDRRVCEELDRQGVRVSVRRVQGGWPCPDARARSALDDVLTALPDGAVVLGDGLVLDGVPEVVARHAERLRLVSLVHLPLDAETGLDPTDADRLRAAERSALAACRAVVVTGSWAEAAVRALGVPAPRVHLVEPGTDPAPPALGSPEGGSLLCLAALIPRKAQHLLVEALTGLTDLTWICRLAGPLDRDPGYADRVAAMVDSRGLGGRVRLTGPVTGPDLEAAWARSDLLVLPSYAETYGMVVAEALARGVPVLTTAGGGSERTAASAALLVPAGDVGALRAALRAWLTDADLRRDLRERASAAGRTLAGWDVTAVRLATVLEAVSAG